MSGRSASFSQDGSVLVTVGSSGFVGWDVDGAEMLSPVYARDRGCRMSVYAEFIDAVLCPTVTGPVIAYDLESGNEFRQFDAPPAEDCAIAVSSRERSASSSTSNAHGLPGLEWRLDGAGPVSHLAYRTSSPHYVEQYGFGG